MPPEKSRQRLFLYIFALAFAVVMVVIFVPYHQSSLTLLNHSTPPSEISEKITKIINLNSPPSFSPAMSPSPSSSAEIQLDGDDEPFIPNVRRRLADSDISAEHAPDFVRNVYKNWRESFDEEKLKMLQVVPAMVIPTFHDGEFLENLLSEFDTPVRHITFICNADDERVMKILLKHLEPLRKVGAISIYKRFTNAGFSTAINLGLRRSRRVLTLSKNWNFDLYPLWFFIVNCDSIFTPGAAAHFSMQVMTHVDRSGAAANIETQYESPDNQYAAKENSATAPAAAIATVTTLSSHSSYSSSLSSSSRHRRPFGLFYTTRLDHFCFGVSDAAVQAAGDMDEVFHPAYFEDVDWRWRVLLAGFNQLITGADVGHHRSVNLKKMSDNNFAMHNRKNLFMQMLERSARGWEYGRMKWGAVVPGKLKPAVPPTGRTTPFGIKNFPLRLYVIDPVHRHCILTGEGPKFLNSNTCWYNGTGLLKFLPAGTRLPEFLVRPVESMREYYRNVEKAANMRAIARGRR